MRTISLPLLLLAPALSAQVITGFEEWNAGLPLGWGGAETDLPLSGVQQINNGAHSGAAALGLERTGMSWAFFSTLPLHVDSGAVYGISYWVRGQGRISSMLYDDRFWGDYSTPTASILVNSTTWEEHTGTLMCMHTTDIAEFILIVSETTGPDHLVVDDLTVGIFELEPPPFHTIQEIQQPMGAGDASPYLDSLVSTSGIVTGASNTNWPYGFYIQNGTGPWSGIFVSGVDTMMLGDSVTVYGTVREYEWDFPQFGTETRITNPLAVILHSEGHPDPTPATILPGEESEEQWESTLVHMAELECTFIGSDEWYGYHDFNNVIVGRLMLPFNVTVGASYSVTGIDRFEDMDWIIEPRIESDIAQLVGIEEWEQLDLVAYPNPAVDLLWVKNVPNSGGTYKYVLQDQFGCVVRTGRLEGAPITVADLADGIYIMHVLGGAGAAECKVTVMH